jgi:hypothetical protein
MIDAHSFGTGDNGPGSAGPAVLHFIYSMTIDDLTSNALGGLAFMFLA